jgi:DNA-binding GntR family transcriptional regulator
MSVIFKKEERSTLVVRVANQIREAIRSGKLQPGDRLIETDLANDMQISRHPIREALRYLEKEGLVTTTPFKGAQVTQFTEQDLEELYTLRLSIEELAIRTLVNNLDDAKLKKLEAALANMKRLAVKGALKKYVEADLAFHGRICELCGHQRLLQVWRTLERQMGLFVMFANQPYNREARLAIYQEHLPVFEAIKACDADRAVAQMKSVLDNGFKFATARN